jgi:ArsR family transcriptional regulator
MRVAVPRGTVAGHCTGLCDCGRRDPATYLADAERLRHPARQDLVQLLAREELNVGDIASRVTLSRPTVSHHLLILKRGGLVRTRKQGREVYYRLNKAPIVNTLQGLVDSLTCC